MEEHYYLKYQVKTGWMEGVFFLHNGGTGMLYSIGSSDERTGTQRGSDGDMG